MQQKINFTVIDYRVQGTHVFTLERRADNLFVVKMNGKAVSLSSDEAAARKVFDKPFSKGGEKLCQD